MDNQTLKAEPNAPAVVKFEGPKHTPGRWHLNVHNDGHYYGNITSDLGMKDGLSRICTIAVALKYAPEEKRAANARLIAAAPDMLAALNAALDFIYEVAAKDKDPEGWSVTIKVRAAIAKATAERT